ncbi:hypothetical protein WJ0W_002279 [Paenibacillus melissococcoides]|uniref:N-sulphoglucosamine sulphohydrolase C-terminal domain-containing protein n=1 Tax=Paenibacillus melissococcoides TaxID=2912268 RepID=A0ABM9G0C9_9BACL|nr:MULTISPECIES: sulfatase/phosphatase domain-containing protein [Paenibacillus]MEB9896848.1 hypothetical protein [Bacillus cereus]CAH8245049.1 hypothetical protein WJ0W_002279 [Paenibacillus melissococcoides]CAH8709751.1 hypothetical protein WDD9_002359 [Paenibacillus melissococcoides]CAH8710478.1 hypothetical protein HTL2_002646 [Paenibacillus melissococcoides]GIO81570.1 hypothetical protein J6TS7_51800 [Paenibacillus dendritiformis]
MAPNLDELARTGVPVPAGVDGKSMLAAARGRKREWREYLHGEHAQGMASTHWVTNGKEKLIWYSQTGVEQYFDLVHDPQELHNAIGDAAVQERVAYWRQVLVRELKDREEGYSDGEKLITGRTPITCLSHISIGRPGAASPLGPDRLPGPLFWRRPQRRPLP